MTTLNERILKWKAVYDILAEQQRLEDDIAGAVLKEILFIRRALGKRNGHPVE